MERIASVVEDMVLPKAAAVMKRRPVVVSAEYIQCDPDCEVCGGLGWVRLDRPITDARFGKLERCPNYDHTKDYPVTRHGLESGEIRRLSWQDVVINNDSIRKAMDAVRDTLERGFGWVFLYGGPGLAKTLILKIAVAEMIRGQRPGAYVGMAALLDDLRAAYDTDEPSRESARRLELWSDIEVLAIDEFDKVNETQYAKERRFMLLDNRYVQAIRQRSVTLIASNQSPRQFDPYVYDRIRDGRFAVVHVEGESARPILDWTQDY